MTTSNNVIRYFNMVFAVTYVGMGIGAIWKHKELSQILNGYSIPFGILLIVYGLYRGYRVFQRAN